MEGRGGNQYWSLLRPLLVHTPTTIGLYTEPLLVRTLTSIGSPADQYSFFSSTIVEPASFAYTALFSCRSEEEERLMAQLKKREIRSVVSDIIAWGYMSVHSERENISMF